MKNLGWMKMIGLMTVLGAAFALNACSNPEPAATGWAAAKTYDDKLVFMGTTVFSAMDKLFKEHDKTRFEKFACENCHGVLDPKKGEEKYKMPSAIALDPKNLPKNDDPKHGAIAKFMREKVLPDFIKIMGFQAYDPATKKGFGCFGCHKTK